MVERCRGRLLPPALSRLVTACISRGFFPSQRYFLDCRRVVDQSASGQTASEVVQVVVGVVGRCELVVYLILAEIITLWRRQRCEEKLITASHSLDYHCLGRPAASHVQPAIPGSASTQKFAHNLHLDNFNIPSSIWSVYTFSRSR